MPTLNSFLYRTVVKSDAEAAIKGKQWILSSYGPFKDKPSLPNFEDQSFEEIRSLCYEAKNSGTLQTLLPQLSQQAADATYKMSMLCDLNNINNNLLNMLVGLYNSGDSIATTQSSLSNSNPFAISVGSNQSSSLFGNSTNQQQQNPFGGSLFASAPTTTSSSIFGGSGTSVFGGQNSFGGSTTNSFGGGGSATPFSLSQIGEFFFDLVNI